jgi:hypothetical protein
MAQVTHGGQRWRGLCSRRHSSGSPALCVPGTPVHYSRWFLAQIEEKVTTILTSGRTRLGRERLGHAVTGRLLRNGAAPVAHFDDCHASKLSPRDSPWGSLPPPMLQLWRVLANWLHTTTARVLGLSVLQEEIRTI